MSKLNAQAIQEFWRWQGRISSQPCTHPVSWNLSTKYCSFMGKCKLRKFYIYFVFHIFVKFIHKILSFMENNITDTPQKNECSNEDNAWQSFQLLSMVCFFRVVLLYIKTSFFIWGNVISLYTQNLCYFSHCTLQKHV